MLASEAQTSDPRELLENSALNQRRIRPRDPFAHLTAFSALSSLIARDPAAAVQRFLDVAVDLCEAGSAGWSRLGNNEAGEKVFHWDALAGRLAPHVGGTTPRSFSPCGLCLDAGTTVLVARPARIFTYFNSVDVPIIEALIVPVYATDGGALGTIWVVHHDGQTFDTKDAQVMEELAVQLVLALKCIEDAKRHQQEIAAKLALVNDTDHRVKNTIQSISSLLRLQARGCKVPEARATLEEAIARLAVFSKIHELLHEDGDGNRAVDIGLVIEKLGEASQIIFANGERRITVRVQAEHVSLESRLAMPLALLVNEAITNAYKHAYPDGATGEIRVSLARDGNGGLNVAVQDDGIGLKHGGNSSVGLKLIKSFAAQVGGTLVVETSPGMTIRLTLNGHEAT